MFDEMSSVIRHFLAHRHSSYVDPPIAPKRVSMVAMKIRYLIEQLVPVEVKPNWVTQPHSRVVKKRVLRLVWEAGGDDSACVVYALLICRKYFRRMAQQDLVEAGLHNLRKLASEHMAKLIIDSISDGQELIELLLRRYSILFNGAQTPRISAVELAVDLHAVGVISTHNYQQCITAIWRGYYTIQYHDDGRLSFRRYQAVTSPKFIDHFDHQRIKVPLYQNVHNLFYTLLFILLYTLTINQRNRDERIDFIEGLMYAFAWGFFIDALAKIYRDNHLFTFWHTYNLLLYGGFVGCFVLRTFEIKGWYEGRRSSFLSYDILACLAPFLYCRQLLHLNFFKFFGIMIIVLEKMIKETAIFFLLLVVIGLGFLQSFFAFDPGSKGALETLIHVMTQAFLDSPDFDYFNTIRPPFGIVLFYLFNAIVSVLLLNILIALFNQAYSVVTDRAGEEFLALFSNKTLEYIRAPDENTYLPPFNLIKFLILVPISPFLSTRIYQRLSNRILQIVYLPSLCLIALYESKYQAKQILKCRMVGVQDGEQGSGWDIESEFDPEGSGWGPKVKNTIPHIEEDEMYILHRMQKDLRNVSDSLGIPKPATIPVTTGDGNAPHMNHG